MARYDVVVIGAGLGGLTAGAILEEFLNDEKSKRYEPGVRYFWGHRIPETV